MKPSGRIMTKLLAILALAVSLHAEDAPKPTVEELQTKVAEQSKEIAKLSADMKLQGEIGQAFHDQADTCNIQLTIANVKAKSQARQIEQQVAPPKQLDRKSPEK